MERSISPLNELGPVDANIESTGYSRVWRKKTWNPYRKIAQKLSNEYRGRVNSQSVERVCVKNLPDDEVERIDSIDELKNVVSDDVPTLVYVTDKSETPSMLKALAWNQKNRIRVEVTYDSSTDDLLLTPVLPGLEAHEDLRRCREIGFVQRRGFDEETNFVRRRKHE